jgi:hypothetical protein
MLSPFFYARNHPSNHSHMGFDFLTQQFHSPIEMNTMNGLR